MPIFGCFTLSALCGTSPQIEQIARVPHAWHSHKQRTETPDELFFLTYGWPAGLPFEVHQHQIEHIRTSAVELYDVALRELGGAMAWSSDIGFSVDTIKLQVGSDYGQIHLIHSSTRYIQKLRRFVDDWARLNRMEAYLRENEIKGEVSKHHTQLYMFAKDFQEVIELGVWNARYARARALDLAALEVTLGIICRTPEDLDALKKEDKLLVQWFMQHLQRKIATTPKHLTDPYLSALISIHRRTRFLPPLSDLAHEISRHDTFPFMRGGQSDIWRGAWLGLPVALKLVRNVSRRSGATVRRMSISSSAPDTSDNDTQCPGGDAARAFKREAEIWRQLMHDNVHTFLGVWVHMDDVYLVSPFMERGDAAEWVRTRNDADRLKLMLEIAQGLEYLHLRSPAVIHGDLRLANVLISDSGSACITDFGLARVLEGLTLTPVCRVLSAISRENIIFVRLLKCAFPPPVPGSCPEERVIRTHRLYKNWDLAALPVTVRTNTVSRVSRRQPEPIVAPSPVAAPPPLAYHLPPGADAYPFLKLETFAPFRDPTTKQASFGPDPPIPIAFPTETQPVNPDLNLTEATRSLVQAQIQHITRHQPESGPSRPPLASNFAAAVVRAWETTQPPNVVSPACSHPLVSPPPPPAPAPRPTRVSSLPLRAIFAKIVGGGRWGVFVVKRDPKGKQRADAPSLPLTTEALASLDKGKGKQREQVEVPTQPVQVDEEALLVVYNLDEVFRGSGNDPERAKVAEHTLKMTPSTMTCRTTEKGLVVVLVKSSTTGAGAGSSWTTILRWDYTSPELKGLSMHKSSGMLGAISIAELEVEKELRTLVAIVHRPRTIMIQDVDSGQRRFVKLGKVPPIGTTVHLIPGPRILVLRTVQAEQASYALEEYEVPPMGETSQPTVPLQRQWIRSPDLQNCIIVEGPTYADGSLPDLALWTFETVPHRAVTHWLLRPVSTADDSSIEADLGHESPVSFGVDSDVYTPGTAPYVFPAQKIHTSKLSFPHHKITLASGARRGMWFERPERSRSGQARGMRGVWGYTAIEAEHPVVRSCTSELPENVLGAMENNTLGVAFDELSGRMVAITCGDGYSALTGSQVWVLDYA
ncbi:unnamed protein product [Rhizoctonia solani]|uniref:Protein kinase domain-containing protein n=1 Tax=Rhizoctonia solani TaxID=456999 RepID=A0A8H3DW93_9AGAM|nr:unnamed protein product [Rhizoctonia solani]